MRILGINSGRAAPPKDDPGRRRRLADGSAAVLIDGRISCAAIEERHRRVRYAGGFATAAPAVLAAADCGLQDVDVIGFSTCCDSLWRSETDRLDAVIEELQNRYPADEIRRRWAGLIHSVDHHDSHAMLAFVGSGYRKSLVCVIDGFGNRLDDADRFHAGSDWWRGRFERQTVYIAEWLDGRVRLERVHQGATGADEIGLAELYRSVTHFMGWTSYQYAGKTMALASYGNSLRFERLSLVQTDPDKGIRVNVANRHDDPVGQVTDALVRAGYKVPEGLVRPARPNESFLVDLAALLQKQLEQAIVEFVGNFADRYGTTSVAFAGGLALNCIALGKLARARPDLHLYVPPAPGDTGEGLGNALWLAYAEGSPVKEAASPQPIRSAAMGPAYHQAAIAAAVDAFTSTRRGLKITRTLSSAALAEKVAELVAEGQIVGVRVGRAEYGPRALGQCSILADPRDPSARVKVNELKRREDFRPFAASILQDHTQSFFPGALDSPFMSFAATAAEEIRRTVPGVVHVDGTTRYQTISETDGLLGAVIREFYRRTGVPLILNTSFNLAGEPMVETPAEALDVFDRSSLDGLVLGSLLITPA